MDIPTIFLLVYLLFPLLAALFISFFIPFYEPGRYEAVVLPAFILLLARFWSSITHWVAVGLVCSLLFFLSYQNVRQDADLIAGYATNDRTAAEYLLAKLNRQNDLIIFSGLSRPSFEYYFSRAGKPLNDLRWLAFPAQLKDHPAYLGFPENPEKLTGQTESILDEINQTVPGKVFLIRDSQDSSSTLLAEKLQQSFGTPKIIPSNSLNPQEKPSNQSPFHYDQLLIFQK